MATPRGLGAEALPRRVDDCPHRVSVARRPDGETARCRLIEEPFGACVPIPVPRAACVACSSTAPPSPERPNGVVASYIFAHAESLLLAGGRTDDPPGSTASIRQRAESEPAMIWTTPNHPRWAGDVPGLRSVDDVIDPGVVCDTFAAHLRGAEAFAYLRYGDGEWLSMLGRAGRNCDGQDFAPATLGTELRSSLEYAGGLWPDNGRFYVGLHAGRLSNAVRRHLVERGLTLRVHWVGDNLLAIGLNDLSTLRFLLAVRDAPGPKLLVANETLAPIARGLNCHHVIVPRFDSHSELDSIEDRCRSCEPSLVLCCAGMTSEPLICRLHRANPGGTYVDCGSIFDALVGRLTRDYTRENVEGVLGTLAERYAPTLMGSTEGCAG